VARPEPGDRGQAIRLELPTPDDAILARFIGISGAIRISS